MEQALKRLKIAVLHDWFYSMGGAERLVETLLDILPDCDIFTLMFNAPKISHRVKAHRITTSFLQKFPGVRHYYRMLLPLYPVATEQFDFRDYDLVLSSDTACVKGLLKSSRTCHVCYCHTPIRYAWDMYHDYLAQSRANPLTGWLMRLFLHYIRMYDFQAAQRVDYFVANSGFVARRIRNIYRRDSTVIYPPVDVERFRTARGRKDYYLIVSRLVRYKRIDLAVEAFRGLRHRLLVVGEGPELRRLRKLAPSNVQLVGYADDQRVLEYMQCARGYILTSREDFGIAAVEAQACGKPVLAFGMGGACETVLDGATGVHFHEQTVASLRNAVQKAEATDWDIDRIRCHAEKFSRSRFLREMESFLAEALTRHQEQRHDSS